MAREDDQYDRVCKEAFGHLSKKLDRLDEAIRGNADKIGLLTRIDRLERAQNTRTRLSWIIAAAVVALAVTQAVRLLWPGAGG